MLRFPSLAHSGSEYARISISLEVGEVVGVAALLVLIFMLVLLNSALDHIRFDSQGLNLLLVGTVDLSLDLFVEFEVGNDGLLLLHIDGGVLESLGVLVDLTLERGPLGDGHTELGQLEKDLEVGEEVDHVDSGRWVADSVQERALLAIGILIDAASESLEPVAIHVGRHAVLDCFGEGLRSCEDCLTIGSVRARCVLLNEPADVVEDLATSANGAAGTGREDALDLLETVLVAALEELGLGLGHALDQLLDVAELLRGGSLELLLIFVALLESLELCVRLIVLSLDLFGRSS